MSPFFAHYVVIPSKVIPYHDNGVLSSIMGQDSCVPDLVSIFVERSIVSRLIRSEFCDFISLLIHPF